MVYKPENSDLERSKRCEESAAESCAFQSFVADFTFYLPLSGGGNPRSARISRLQALPRRRRRPICRWCEHPGQCLGGARGGQAPAQEPQCVPPFSLPGASVPGTSCCAHQPSPTATPPSPALSPSYPSPSPLSLVPVLTLCLPDSSRRKCGFHLGFGLVPRKLRSRPVCENYSPYSTAS